MILVFCFFFFFFFLMIRRPPRSTHCISSAASDVYKRQIIYFSVCPLLFLYVFKIFTLLQVQNSFFNNIFINFLFFYRFRIHKQGIEFENTLFNIVDILGQSKKLKRQKLLYQNSIN
eukprot:TRINITY_DN2015_c0_g1_i1.p2 TRINITY_DN2015_c0_g1~~TRINITY_DN2015_c0_g1_i1.p2  ORF type:complete len:117 (+),score=25.96 TRINITY_DN2015_c0_g1_i1:105-455(+)